MPPKRMTANIARPARYRPGKSIAPVASDSESDSDTSHYSKSEIPPNQNSITLTTASAVTQSLKHVNLQNHFENGRQQEEERLSAIKTDLVDNSGLDNEDQSDQYTTASNSYSEDSADDGDTEAEGPARRTLLRPAFIPKNKRDKHPEMQIPNAQLEKEANELKRQNKEAQELLEAHLKRQSVANSANRKYLEDESLEETTVDDTDGIEPAAERVRWKLRELLRIKREREALEVIEKEREEIERRREMDPELRHIDDMEFVQRQKKEKLGSRGKMGFMQKFYHKGAFYQDDSKVLKRDYATAVVDDSVNNREVLPKYMQVRGDEVGKRGRTKWTHLTAEDTSLQKGKTSWSDLRAGAMADAGIYDKRFKPDHRSARAKDKTLRKERYLDRPQGSCEDELTSSPNKNYRPSSPQHTREISNRKRSYSPRVHEFGHEKRRRWDQQP